MTPSPVQDIEDLHRIACLDKKSYYIDPNTRLLVFTAYHLSQRKCCGCGCRHCPYKPKSHVAPSSSFLNGSQDDLPDAVDVLFWSGGKDSFLALRRLQAADVRPIVLLTTYDHPTGLVAHQEVDITDITTQARRLQLPLLAVPVGGASYVQIVTKALARLRDDGIDVVRVAFGDLHLQHVREWRDTALKALGASLHYPLWKVSYDDLLDDLLSSGAVARVSAVSESAVEAGVKVGDKFDSAFVRKLPKGIDRFGENGEFHTLVNVPETSKSIETLEK